MTRKYPLVMYWREHTGTEVGDFTYVPGAGYLVKKVIADDLMNRYAGVACTEVTMVQSEQLSAHKRRRKDTMYLPYEGPPVVELLPMKSLSRFDFEQITFTDDRCSVCGTATGWVARNQDDCLPSSERLRVKYSDEGLARPSDPSIGLILSQSRLGNNHLFRIEEGHIICCTDEFRSYCLERGFTNINFIEMGVVID